MADTRDFLIGLFIGTAIGAAAAVLPPKGILCMPCHAATFSAVSRRAVAGSGPSQVLASMQRFTAAVTMGSSALMPGNTSIDSRMTPMRTPRSLSVRSAAAAMPARTRSSSVRASSYLPCAYRPITSSVPKKIPRGSVRPGSRISPASAVAPYQPSKLQSTAIIATSFR